MGHKARTRKANGNTPKEKKKPVWPEAKKKYPSFDLDLRPEYFERSYKKLLEDILALLAEEVDHEMSKLPKKDRKPTKVNGKQYTPAKGSGGFLVRLLPASGDPEDEVILLYGLDDLYLQGFNAEGVWFILLEATIAIPPSTQVPYGCLDDMEEDEESPFDDGIHILSWTGRYPDLDGGQYQPFHYKAFEGARTLLKNARRRVLHKDNVKLQPGVAFFAVGIAEAVRFGAIGDWVLIQSTNPFLDETNGNVLQEPLDVLTNSWGTESNKCYGPNHHLTSVRVVKRNSLLHSKLKPETVYQKKESKKANTEEVEEDNIEEVKELQKPFVSVKESIQGEAVGLIESLEGPLEIAEMTTPDGRFSVRVRVFRLMDALTTLLDDRGELLSESTCPHGSHDVCSYATELREHMINALESELEAMSVTVESSRLLRYRETMLGHFKRIWALGPSQAPTNLLLSPDGEESHGSRTSQDGREAIVVCGPCHVSEKLGFVTTCTEENNIDIDESELSRFAPFSEALRNDIVLGFHLAMSNGPLCDEPVWGLAFIVEPYIFADNSDEGSYEDSTFSWQVTMAVKEACVAAICKSNPRLVQPILLCQLTMPSHRLDAVRAVLEDCQGKVLRVEMPENAPLFTVHAHLPAVESSEFSANLKKRTSAAAHALLVFSHWEAIYEDPFFIPKNPEEIKEFGVGPNLARTLMDSVRQRKGLHIEELDKEHRTHAKEVMEGKENNKEDIKKDMPINEEAIQGSGHEFLEPVVSFKETVIGWKGQLEFVERTTPDGKFSVRIGVYRLPDELTKMLDDNANLLSETVRSQSSPDVASATTDLREQMVRAMINGVEAISGRVNLETREQYKKTVLRHFQRIWALGPSQAAPNLLVLRNAKSSSRVITTQDGRKRILLSGRCHVSERLGFLNAATGNSISNSALATDVPEPEALKNSIILGFQAATCAGPLCDEPMWGLAFIVEPYIFSDESLAASCSHPHQHRMLSWHISKAVRDACRAAVLQSKPRLVQQMNFCELTTPTDELGAVHAVLGDCRAKVLKEEIQEGTSLLHANLPVAESSKFSEKLRNTTSGAVSICLVPSHWEIIPEDPIFIPRTQEEIEKSGDGINYSRNLVHSVRRRKGLHIEDEVSEDCTNQQSGAKKV